MIKEGFNLSKIKNLFLCLLAGSIALILTGQPVKASQQYVHSSTPTLFFHGYNSGAHAEQYMINGIKKPVSARRSLPPKSRPTARSHSRVESPTALLTRW